MVIKVRDKREKPHFKDLLDLDFDMYVEAREGKGYRVVINPLYALDGTYEKEEDAEEAMDQLAQKRNALEEAILREI